MYSYNSPGIVPLIPDNKTRREYQYLVIGIAMNLEYWYQYNKKPKKGSSRKLNPYVLV